MNAIDSVSHYGAASLSRLATTNPREIVIQLVRDGCSKKDAFDEFRTRIANNDALQRAVDWYFFTNMFDYEASSRNGNSPFSPLSPTHEADHKARIDQFKGKIMLLALTMPNEKPMRDCTGSDMDKFGGAYKAIAKRVGPNKTVGEVLTEDQVRAMLK